MSELLLEVRFEVLRPHAVEHGAAALKDELVHELHGIGLAPAQSAVGASPRRLMVLLRGLPPAAGESVGKLASALERVLERRPWQGPQPAASAGVSVCEGLLVLLDGVLVAVSALGQRAERTTVGHLVHSPQELQIAGGADYARQLITRGIEIRPHERVKRLGERLLARAGELELTLVEDETLLHHTAHQGEMCNVIAVPFDPVFLELPEELLIEAMRDRFSAFALRGRSGALAPVVLLPLDRMDDPEGSLRPGLEWSTHASLSAARALWHWDHQTPLAERYRRLGDLRSGDRGSTLLQRADRLSSLVAGLFQARGWAATDPALAESGALAAQLLLADRTTLLVRELPGLSGTVSGLLAQREGYPEQVWRTLREIGARGSLPEPSRWSRCALLLRLAVALEGLVTEAGARGAAPAGEAVGSAAQLERARRVLGDSLAGGVRIDLDLVLASAARTFGDELGRPREEVVSELRAIVRRAARDVLVGEGFRGDEVGAVLHAALPTNPIELIERAGGLRSLRDREEVGRVARVTATLGEMLLGEEDAAVDVTLLVEPAELELHELLRSLRPRLDEHLSAERAEGWLAAVTSLVAATERLVSTVLIKSEQESLRRNRIAMLQAVQRALHRQLAWAELGAAGEGAAGVSSGSGLPGSVAEGKPA